MCLSLCIFSLYSIFVSFFILSALYIYLYLNISVAFLIYFELLQSCFSICLSFTVFHNLLSQISVSLYSYQYLSLVSLCLSITLSHSLSVSLYLSDSSSLMQKIGHFLGVLIDRCFYKKISYIITEPNNFIIY